MLKLNFGIILIFCYSVVGDPFLETFKNVENFELSDEDKQAALRDGFGDFNEDSEDKILALKYKRMFPDDAYVFSSPGDYVCDVGDEFYIKSPNFPDYPPGYPPNLAMTWTFTGGDPTVSDVELTCPVISTRHSRGCRTDRLAVFWGTAFTKARKFCGVFVNKVFVTPNQMKVRFRTNDDDLSRLGFLCRVRCMAPQTTTTSPTTTTTTSTTTTFMPGCAIKPECSPMPTQVNNCSQFFDIPPQCQCIDCEGSMTIYCDICTPCDLEMFLNYEIMVPITLGINCVCPQNGAMIDTYFCGNNLMVTALENCYSDNRDCFSEDTFPNAGTFFYKFCTPELCFDTCLQRPYLCNSGRTNFIQPAIETHRLEMIKEIKNTKKSIKVISFDCDSTTNLCTEIIEYCVSTVPSNSFDATPGIVHFWEMNLTCASEIENNFLHGDMSSLERVTINLSLDYIPEAVKSLLFEVEVKLNFQNGLPECEHENHEWLEELDDDDILNNLIASCIDDDGETVSVNEEL